MKKSVIIAILGLTAAAAAYGQGTIVFSSYVSNGGAGNLTYWFGTTSPIGTPLTALLYYANGTVTDPVNNSSASSVASPVSGSFTLAAGSAAAYDNSGAATGTQGLGYFDGPTLTIPIAGYNGTTPVSFEIVAFNGSSYANSSDRGRSGAWTESQIVQLGLPAGNMGDHGTVPVIYVVPGPEPGTLALTGLGGLAALIALHRKRT